MSEIKKKQYPPTVLVAGATGFIGSYLLGDLLKRKFKVIILKRSDSDTQRVKKYLSKVKSYDIDKVGLERPFKDNKIDFVVNLITNYGRGAHVLPSQVMATNVVLLSQMVEQSIAHEVGCFISIDSSLNQDLNLYAYSKRVFRNILKNNYSNSIKVFNLQLEYIYGRSDDLAKFLPMAIDKLKRGQNIDMTLGEQALDFTDVRDVADAICYVIDHASGYRGNFTDLEIGNGKTTKLKDLVLMAKKLLNSKSKINFGVVPYRKNEQMFSQADLSAIDGWKPKYNLKVGIKELVK